MRAAVLGLGEAGRVFAGALVTTGWEVSAFDPVAAETPDGVERADSASDAARGAALILSLTTAAHAVGAARDAGTALEPGAVYLDLNAASPATKREAAEALGRPEAFVDGAVLGSVLSMGAGVDLLLSGARAETAAGHLGAIGARPQIVGEAPGAASQRKLIRSVFVKSLAAGIAEAMDAGRAFGDESWMREEIAAWLADGEATVDRLDHTTRLHAQRRSHELRDSLDVLAELGTPSTVAEGALAAHLRFARAGGDDLAAALAAVPTAALGDAAGRQGLLHSAIKPVWASAPVAGRAFTIRTRAGDNRAIHEAIASIRPGDIVVIDGRGETERALIGDLIAERLRDTGAVGVVLDAAIRDAAGIAELGFPTFARAVSPAGPYRHGPGDHQVPISAGGVVVHPDDWIVADDDGVIVIPALQAEETLRGGQAKIAAESAQREAHRASQREVARTL